MIDWNKPLEVVDRGKAYPVLGVVHDPVTAGSWTRCVVWRRDGNAWCSSLTNDDGDSHCRSVLLRNVVAPEPWTFNTCPREGWIAKKGEPDAWSRIVGVASEGLSFDHDWQSWRYLHLCCLYTTDPWSGKSVPCDSNWNRGAK